MDIGYSFWGSLADVKMKDHKLVSTPDGNATYSSVIINQLQSEGHTVYRLQENRDAEIVAKRGANAFLSFCQEERYEAYKCLINCPYSFPKLDLILFEWRMPVPGRNTMDDMELVTFEPDLLRQIQLLSHYAGKAKIVVFDLDYKLEMRDEVLFDDVIELGYKRGIEHHVDIPVFPMALYEYADMSSITHVPKTKSVTYIGNRYERDDSIDMYLVPLASLGYDVNLYGNWIERGRDSKTRWPQLRFHPRAQLCDFRSILYETSVVPLLLKDEYYEHGFMTARIIETLVFGSVPALPSKFLNAHEWLPKELIFTTVEELALIIEKSHDVRWKALVMSRARDMVFNRCDPALFTKRLLSCLFSEQ